MSVNAEFRWGKEEQASFDKIKKILINALIFTLLNPSKLYILETDASNFAVGTVLLQRSSNSLKHPIAYYSRKMLLTEMNYPIYNKKLLVIVVALSK